MHLTRLGLIYNSRNFMGVINRREMQIQSDKIYNSRNFMGVINLKKTYRKNKNLQ